MNKKITQSWALFLSLFLAPAALMWSQENEPEEGVEDEIETLSPFDVTGVEDLGYRATSTLAGTRVRTDLRDIGSSITIVNQEFLEDTDSTDLQDVLIFTPNTEVGGINGNFSASQGFGAGNPIPELERDSQQGGVTRIRGLAEADLTRNYFQTEIPFDSYNVQRIAVQRGANSALFGLGSPGGIVNHQLIRADFLRDRGRIRFETDQWGTSRTSFRVNEILMEDRFSIFLAGLHDDEKFEQEEAFAKDRRIYGAVKWKVNNNINVFGNIEFGDRDRSAPDFTPPNDGITPWLNTGKPTFNGGIDSANFGRNDFRGSRGLNTYTTFPGGVGRGFVNFFHDTTNPESTFGGNVVLNSGHTPPGTQNDPGIAPEWRLLQPWPEEQIIRRSGLRSTGEPVPAGTAGFYVGGNVTQQILDRSIYDYREHLFSGGSSQQRADWRSFQIGAEGTWFDDRLGLEVTYYDQDWDENAVNALQGSAQRTIFIDPNRFLIATTDGDATGTFDGSGSRLVPNPSFGQPVMGGLSGGNQRTADRETIRATLFAEVRATDFMDDNLASKILGRMKLTFNSQNREIRTSEAFARDKIDQQTVANNTLTGNDIANRPGSNFFRTGNAFTLPVAGSVDFLNATSINDIRGANIQPVPFGKQRNRPPRTNTFTAFDEETLTFNEFTASTFNILDNSNFPASFFSGKDLVEIDSQTAVAQWYLWDDTVVLTRTLRKDKQQTASQGAPGDPVIPEAENVFDPQFVRGPVNPVVNANEQTRSWSVMIHTPDFIKEFLPWGTEISLYKSDASNFQPSGDRVNVFNEQIDSVTGSTIEQGFILSTLNGKLNIRANWYETGVLNQSFDVGGVSASEGILLGLVRQLNNPNNAGFSAADVQAALPPQGVLDVNGFVWDGVSDDADTNRKSSDNGTQDFTSEGNEIEITYNPNPRWTMLLAISRQETITANTYPVLSQYVQDFVEPVWVNSNFAQNYFIDDQGTTLAQAATDRIVTPVARAQTQDGIPQIEQREWRYNFNTSYNFGRDNQMIPGFLGNLTVGGGFRWQDEVGVGFGVSQNALGEMALDPNQPFFGDSQLFVDLFFRSSYDLGEDRALTFQVNVKDVLDHSDDLVPVFANPDNSRIYRFIEGRVVTASATFEW